MGHLTKKRDKSAAQLDCGVVRYSLPRLPMRYVSVTVFRAPCTQAARYDFSHVPPRSNTQFVQHGFTLLELLVVMVIAGILLGLVSFKAMPDDKQVLQQDAQRIALLLQIARDEAIVRNRPIAFEADANRYRFLIREESNWLVLAQDEMLRERDFKRSPVTFSMSPVNATLPLRIQFGHEPVDKPFLLTLTIGEAHAVISADGIGHFAVE